MTFNTMSAVSGGNGAEPENDAKNTKLSSVAPKHQLEESSACSRLEETHVGAGRAQVCS